MHAQRHPIFPLLLVIFLGFIGFSLPFPIFSPLFLDPSHQMGLSSDAMRTMFLGLTLGAYPLGQFVGSPLLGQLSDHHGRKRILLYSLVGTTLSYVLSAYSTHHRFLWLLILSRFLCGITEGNFVIAQAIVTDISQGVQRVRNFGFINIAGSLGFVIGPILGGKLADPTIVKWFDYATPFWFAALFSLLTVFLTLWQLPETHLPQQHKEKLHPLIGLHKILRGFGDAKLRGLYIVNFVLYLGIFLFYQFYPANLVAYFNMTPSKIADVSAYLGISIALAQLLIVHPLAKILSPKLGTLIGMAGMAPLIVLLAYGHSYFDLYLYLPLASCFMALATTNLQSVVSHSVTRQEQGKVLGTSYAVRIMGEVLTALLGGWFAGMVLNLPLLIGGVLLVLSVFIFLSIMKGIEEHHG